LDSNGLYYLKLLQAVPDKHSVDSFVKRHFDYPDSTSMPNPRKPLLYFRNCVEN